MALVFGGLSYLVWALVAGISRDVVQEMIRSTSALEAIPRAARIVKICFVDGGVVIDVVGLAWLMVSLLLLGFSSRQKFSISWAWVSATSQGFVASLGAVLVGWAAYQPHIGGGARAGSTHLELVSSLSLQIIMPLALLLWVSCLVWLLVERARLNRRGPTLRDGLRTNVYR